MLQYEELTYNIRAAAMEVHQTPGRGLLKFAYEGCLCRESPGRSVVFERQIFLSVSHKGLRIDCRYRSDNVVQDTVVLELKYAEQFPDLQKAHLLSCMKVGDFSLRLSSTSMFRSRRMESPFWASDKTTVGTFVPSVAVW